MFSPMTIFKSTGNVPRKIKFKIYTFIKQSIFVNNNVRQINDKYRKFCFIKTAKITIKIKIKIKLKIKINKS